MIKSGFRFSKASASSAVISETAVKTCAKCVEALILKFKKKINFRVLGFFFEKKFSSLEFFSKKSF